MEVAILASMSAATETSIADLLAQTSVLEAERDRWQTERDALDARIAARERLIAALRSEAELRDTRLFDVAPAPPSLGRLRASAPHGNENGNGANNRGHSGATADGILAVLEQSQGPMTSAAIYAELDRRGWAPLGAANPKNAVRQSLLNLAKNGSVAKLGTSTARRWAKVARKTSPVDPEVHARGEGGGVS